MVRKAWGPCVLHLALRRAPDVFLPLSSGLMNPISAWAVRRRHEIAHAVEGRLDLATRIALLEKPSLQGGTANSIDTMSIAEIAQARQADHQTGYSAKKQSLNFPLVQEQFDNATMSNSKMTTTGHTFLLISAIGLCACGGGGGDDAESTVFCMPEAQAAEPSFTIQSAIDKLSGLAIPEITLTNITFQGVPINVISLSNVSVNVTAIDKSIQCKIPCGFATDEGLFTMTVNAPTLQPLVVSVDASYSTLTRGCPSVLSGGKRVSFVL